MSQIKEIAKRLKAAMPDRAICAKNEYWCHQSGIEDAVIRISVLPGLDGTECSINSFSTHDELLAWVNDTITQHSCE